MTSSAGLQRKLASAVIILAMAVLFLGLTASAQADIPVLLFNYPNTINNTAGIAAPPIRPGTEYSCFVQRVIFVSGRKTLLHAIASHPGDELLCRLRDFMPAPLQPQISAEAELVLRDFGYDTELMGRDELDETQLVGLRGG